MEKLFLVSRKYYFFLIAGLIAFIPLYPKFPLMNVPKTFVAIRIEDVFIALSLFLWLIFNIHRIKKYLRMPVFQAILLFWAIGLLSVISALWISHSVSPSLSFLHYFRRIEYISLFLIGATMISSVKQVKIISIVLLITSAIVTLYGFGQIYFKFPVISTTNSEFSKGLILYLSSEARVNSTFAGHYDLAVFLSLALVFASSMFFYYKNIFLKLLLLLLGLANFALLGFTAARVSFVATIIGLSSVFWLNNKKILVVILFLCSLISVAAIPELRHRLVATITVNLLGGGGPKYSPPPGKVTVFTPIKQIPKEEREKVLKQLEADKSATPSSESGISADTAPGEPVNPTELGVYRSFGIRFNVEWPRALNAFYRNPFLGSGYSSISLATDNDLLRSLGETGILGTLALGLVFYIIIRRMYLFLSKSFGFERFFIVAVLTFVGVILITGIFIDVLEASKIAEILWLVLGISWAVSSKYEIGKND